MIDINITADGTITLYECDPAKMRPDILRQFETLPDDTRDIIAQFYIMALSEMLPKWQKTGNKARKTAEKNT